MDYKEPALIGFVQAAIDYLNYSKGNGEKVDLGSLTNADINFLKDSLGLNFDNDAAAILRGHQAFRDIIYKRQRDRDSFNRPDYNNYRPNDIQDNPYNLFRENSDNNYYGENQASSKESSEAIDNLFNQIESNNKHENKINIVKEPKETKKIERDSSNNHVIKDAITRIRNIAGKDLRISNSEDDDPIFDYVDKESDYYKLVRNISKTFTNLSMDFIKDVLSYKEEIDREYPVNLPIILLHRISFDDVENLRRFAEIMINNKFYINADETKGIIDIFMQVINTNGKIITVICDVANQAAQVNGVYEGYKVIKAE